jgi:hypothetical protein
MRKAGEKREKGNACGVVCLYQRIKREREREINKYHVVDRFV